MKYIAFFLTFWISLITETTFSQELKFMFSGTIQVKDYKYDPEVPFAQNQDAAELYIQLLVNDSVVNQWGTTNNNNSIYIPSTQISLQKNQKIELKCFDEDERKSVGLNKDDEIISFQIPTDSIHLSNRFFGEIDTNKFRLRFYPVHAASFQIVSFTPSGPYKGKVKRGMKKEGLRWAYHPPNGPLIRSEIIKSTSNEKLIWKSDSCIIEDCYFRKTLSIDAYIGGNYYIYFMQHTSSTNPYSMKWGDDIISTEYGDFLVRITQLDN